MDQLKPFINAVKKYHFWVVCGTIMLTVLVCWWLATGGLADQYRAETGKIDGVFSGASGIQSNHPNQGVIDEINKRHATLKQVVFDAWEILFNDQKEHTPFPTDVLGEDFKKQFENLRPQEELARRYRERYQNYIKDYFPKLLELIEVRRPVEQPAGEAGGQAAGAGALRPGGPMNAPEMGGIPGTATEIEWTGVIDWNDANYNQILSRFVWEQTPSTLQVVTAQEDLWVYEALLRAIKATNEGATNQNNAVVKRIDALEIGRDAVMAWKNAENVLGLQGSAAGAAGVPGTSPDAMSGAVPPGGDEFSPGATPGGVAGGGASEEQINRQLFDFRYIDDKGTPLPFQPQYPFATHPYAEFKMMPVRMMLVMDQRKIPKLLTECANSNMPIEVRRVRMLLSQGPAVGTGTSGMGSGGLGMGRMGMGTGMEGGYMPPLPPRVGGGGMLGTGYTGGAGAPQEAGQFDAPVEIHATIFIYNPPNRDKLGTGAAAAAPAPAGAAEPVPPANPVATPD